MYFQFFLIEKAHISKVAAAKRVHMTVLQFLHNITFILQFMFSYIVVIAFVLLGEYKTV